MSPAARRPLTVEDGPRAVLNFHGLGPPGADVPEAQRPYWCPADRYEAILDEVVRQVGTDGRRVEITFDDGYGSDVEIGLPALAARGLRATFFVCSDRIGAPGFVGRADLAALLGAGMGIGSHGAAHVDLRGVPPEELEREASGSRTVLAEATGRAVDAFALPFGSYDRRVLRALRSYARVYSSDGARADDGMHPVPRFSVLADWTAADAARACAGRPSAAVRARDALKRRLKGLR